MSVYSDLPDIRVVEGCHAPQIPDWIFESEQPLVLRGLVSNWPAVEACKTSIEQAARYLSQFWSAQPVTVYVGNEDIKGRFFYNEEFTGFNFQSGKAPLKQVLHKLHDQLQPDGSDKLSIYVGSTPVDGWLPGFRTENDVAVPSREPLISFWLGSNTRVSAHYDFPDNIACVVAGRRRFTLFPPDQIDNLYVGPVDRTPSGQAISLVDFEAPDFESFPRFKAALASAQTYVLEPGDALFIPSMWWHHVASLDDFNMLVNYWWCNTPKEMGSPANALLHSILAIRDLPAHQKQAWKHLFDYYVFESSESQYSHIPEQGKGCLAPLDAEGAGHLRQEVIKRLTQ